MTTKVTSLFDALVTVVAATVSGAHRLPNPYDLEHQPARLLENGYAIVMGPTRKLQNNVASQFLIVRDVGIVLTRLIATTQANATHRASIEKTLFEDQLAVIKAINANVTLGGIVADVSWQSDAGLEFLETQDAAGRYFVLSSAFAVTYLETV